MTVPRLANDAFAPTSLAPQGQDGFEQFVAATADRLHRSALLLCGDHHLAEDLTQTTYARVYSRWSTVSKADSPLAYTRTVLMRTFLAHHRLRRSSERPVGVVPESALESPDEAIRVDLLAALAQLSRRDRAVLVLRYWEDFSVRRTAEVLGITESTCRTRAARALVRLRALLPDVTEPDDENGDLS